MVNVKLLLNIKCGLKRSLLIFTGMSYNSGEISTIIRLQNKSSWYSLTVLNHNYYNRIWGGKKNNNERNHLVLSEWRTPLHFIILSCKTIGRFDDLFSFKFKPIVVSHPKRALASIVNLSVFVAVSRSHPRAWIIVEIRERLPSLTQVRTDKISKHKNRW